MSYTAEARLPKKASYKRPYKSRNQRREVDRRKADEAKDFKFLIKVAAGIGVLLLLAVGFAIQGVVDRNSADPSRVEMAK